MPSIETLRIGYSGRTKAAVGAVACLGWLYTYTILGSDASAVAILPGTLAIIATALLAVAFRSGYVLSETSIRHTTWRRTVEYPRAAFLDAETVEEGRSKSGLLLRFQSGVLLLSEKGGCSDPVAARAFLEQHWGLSSASQHRNPIGPVEDSVVLEYEPLQPALLAFATVGLAAVSALGSMFWAAAILAFLTGRAFYNVSRCLRITTDQQGLSVSRPFQPDLTIRWNQITAVRYWYSPAHGGMSLSAGGRTIHIYRWIKNYPLLNRLVLDLAPAASLPAQPKALPWTISLNRRRQVSWLVLFIVAGISLWLGSQGAWPAAALFFAVPAGTFLFTVLASDRRIEINRDSVRLLEKKSFVRTTHEYRKSDLEDMRLGRQLSAGGLWLKFGSERLEIGNLDSECAPEEILAVLRREWNQAA